MAHPWIQVIVSLWLTHSSRDLFFADRTPSSSFFITNKHSTLCNCKWYVSMATLCWVIYIKAHLLLSCFSCLQTINCTKTIQCIYDNFPAHCRGTRPQKESPSAKKPSYFCSARISCGEGVKATEWRMKGEKIKGILESMQESKSYIVFYVLMNSTILAYTNVLHTCLKKRSNSSN